MKVILWNVRWAVGNGAVGKAISAMIAAHDPDVICLTEANRDFLAGGNLIESDADYGYRAPERRRKVLLWSKSPWRRVGTEGNTRLPPGRFVGGVTNTPIGDVTFLGVCIPWRAAHVATGKRNRSLWQDHVLYLQELGSILRSQQQHSMVCLGDFNQTVPSSVQPAPVYETLLETIPSTLVRASMTGALTSGSRIIDHLYHTADITCVSGRVLARVGADGLMLSDHDGYLFELRRT